MINILQVSDMLQGFYKISKNRVSYFTGYSKLEMKFARSSYFLAFISIKIEILWQASNSVSKLKEKKLRIDPRPRYLVRFRSKSVLSAFHIRLLLPLHFLLKRVTDTNKL